MLRNNVELDAIDLGLKKKDKKKPCEIIVGDWGTVSNLWIAV